MPDLGDYTVYVLGAYAVTLMLVVTLCGLTLWRAKRVRAQLAEVEARARVARR